jgi:hypothetical protein
MMQLVQRLSFSRSESVYFVLSTESWVGGSKPQPGPGSSKREQSRGGLMQGHYSTCSGFTLLMVICLARRCADPRQHIQSIFEYVLLLEIRCHQQMQSVIQPSLQRSGMLCPSKYLERFYAGQVSVPLIPNILLLVAKLGDRLGTLFMEAVKFLVGWVARPRRQSQIERVHEAQKATMHDIRTNIRSF